jgi:hypothetical protein
MYEQITRSSNGGSSGTYTGKHKALAKHLSVDCGEIENCNDQIFIFGNNDFWVLTDEEAVDFLINEIDVSFELPFTEYKLSDVSNVVGVTVDEIKECFLPEVLTGELTFRHGSIDSKFLLTYLKKNKSVSYFIENYAKLLVSQNRSGLILCSKNSDIKQNGYNIYCR